MRFLQRFPEYRQSRQRSDPEGNIHDDSGGSLSETPEETLDHAYRNVRDALANEILLQLKQNPASFFEKVVVDLLVKMGYGGDREDAGQAVGGSGDEGIDGIIKEDCLGLDVIYLQAKRWDKPVGRPEIQRFAGALIGQRARKGVFITTSDFTKDAREYSERIETTIVLIAGAQLAQLMIEYDVGVTPLRDYVIKRLDLDYFTE